MTKRKSILSFTAALLLFASMPLFAAEARMPTNVVRTLASEDGAFGGCTF